MAIDDVLSRISAIQARFDSAFGSSALFEDVASDAARHAGLGRDETPVLDPAGESVATAGDETVDGAAAATADDASSGEAIDAMVAAQLTAAASGGSSTLLDLAGSASDPTDQLQLLASFIAQQQASAGLGGSGA
ncbi:MAG: hypothetical protein AAGD18_12175 [Actinomycetota bacterium]